MCYDDRSQCKYNSNKEVYDHRHIANHDYLNYREKNKVNSFLPSAQRCSFGKKIRRICTWLIPITLMCLQLSVSLPKFRKLHDIKNLKCTTWSDAACIILLWKGAPLAKLPEENKIEVTVVISHCGEDINSLTNYLDDKSENITIRDITIISRCPESLPHTQNLAYNVTSTNSQWKHPVLDFVEWLTAHLESAASNSLPEQYKTENHVTVFLNPSSIRPSTLLRGFDQVVQSTMENRFGCFLQSPDDLSYYHSTNVLRYFSSREPNLITHHTNLGEWIDNLNITWILESLVPVCYGSSFAVKSSDLSQTPEQFYSVLKAMENDSKSHQNLEHVEFIDRSLAALFSHALSEKKMRQLRKYSTEVYQGTDYTGALVHRWKMHSWLNFFYGDTLEKKDVDLSQVRLTLVISHCNEDMSWMQTYFKDFNVQNVTIISKCNDEVKGYYHEGAVIIRPPNHGRCDHSWASWMANMTEADATENHIVLFIKASRYLYQFMMRYRSVQDVIRIAMEHGFSCEAEPIDRSMYYRTANLRTLSMPHHRGAHVNFKSPYVNMGHWLDIMQIHLPSPLTPVCYGGNFAAKATQIYPRKDLWNRMVTSLSRTNDIEEGHFAERAWAGILSYPLNSNETAVMASIPIRNGFPRGVWAGQIHLNE